MRPFSLGLLLTTVAVALALANPALARRAPVDYVDESVGAPPPVLIQPPRPPPPLTRAQLQAALNNAQPDLSACLPASAGRPWDAMVRASLSARRGLTVRVQLRPRDATVSRCLDTAARRWLVPLEGRNVAGTLTATLRVRGGGQPVPPPPNPPTPPGPPGNRYDEGLVHAALDRDRTELLRCLPTASTSTPGDIVLRTSVRTDGSVVLEGATLPSGVGAGPVLACLAGVVSRTRVPSPPTTRAVTHVVTLGR
ncbi:MAG: hypothetical protein OHK0013_26210 [Sandaracinaceae bacterium]